MPGTIQSLFETTKKAAPAGKGTVSTGDESLNYAWGMDKILGMQGENILAGGVDTTSKSKDYWGAILGGDKKKLAEATEPERYSIGKAFQAGRQAISMGGRGGGTSSALAESRFEEAGQIGRLVEGQRADAAKSLADVGLKEEQIGLSAEMSAEQSLTSIFETIFSKPDQPRSPSGWATAAETAGKLIVGLLGL
jgi:hypothetical protein